MRYAAIERCPNDFVDIGFCRLDASIWWKGSFCARRVGQRVRSGRRGGQDVGVGRLVICSIVSQNHSIIF